MKQQHALGCQHHIRTSSNVLCLHNAFNCCDAGHDGSQSTNKAKGADSTTRRRISRMGLKALHLRGHSKVFRTMPYLFWCPEDRHSTKPSTAAIPPSFPPPGPYPPEQQPSSCCWSAAAGCTGVVRAGPVLLGLQVAGVLTQTLCMVGCWAHVTAHQLTTVPAHLQGEIQGHA